MSTYSIVVAAYLPVALWLTSRLNERQGISPTRTLTLFALAVPAGSIGARILDVLEYWGRYTSLSDLVGRNGSSIFGGVFAGFAVAWSYARWYGIEPLRLLDAGAPAIALGEAATRVGCFLNGCCYGVPWTGVWAVTFPRDSFAFRDQVAHGIIPPTAARTLPVHPVQLYSVLIMIGVTVYLLRAYKRRRHAGDVLWRFLIAYGVLRLLMAPLRVEALRSMMLFSITFIVVGALGLISGSRRETLVRTAA